MSIQRFRSALTVLFALGFSSVCLAESFQDVEKKIVEAYKKVECATGKMNMETKVSQAGFEMSQTMTATVEHLRKGDKLMYRMDGDASIVQKMGEQESKQTMKTLVVSDGEFTYTVNETNGTKQAFKSKAQEDQLPWHGMQETSNFKILPEEKVGGKDTYVIEMIAKNRPEGDQSRTVYYCLKDVGYPVKLVSYGADGKAMSTMTMTEMDFSAKVPESRFKFTAPEGVEVMEMPGQ